MRLASLRRPDLWALARESQALFEFPRLAWNLRDLARQPRGAGDPVLVFPGFGAGDESTFLLRAYLRGIGHRVRGWGLGRNDGHVPELIPRVAELVRRTAGELGRVRLVGIR